jgi:hypothetical protein
MFLALLGEADLTSHDGELPLERRGAGGGDVDQNLPQRRRRVGCCWRREGGRLGPRARIAPGGRSSD